MRHKYPQESVEQAAKRVVSEMAAAAEERASGFQTVVGENEKRQRRALERSEEKAVRAPAPEIEALSINSSDYPLGRPVEDDLLKFIKAEESCVQYVINNIVSSRNHVSHRCTASTIAKVLVYLTTQPDHQRGEKCTTLGVMQDLFEIIFGFSYLSVPESAMDDELENYGSDSGETLWPRVRKGVS